MIQTFVASESEHKSLWRTRLLTYLRPVFDQQQRLYFIYISSRQPCQLPSYDVLFGYDSAPQISAVWPSYGWPASSWVASPTGTHIHTHNQKHTLALCTSTQSVHVAVIVCLYTVHTANTQHGINRSRWGTLEAQTQLVSLLWWMSGSQMDQRGERKRRKEGR